MSRVNGRKRAQKCDVREDDLFFLSVKDSINVLVGVKLDGELDKKSLKVKDFFDGRFRLSS